MHWLDRAKRALSSGSDFLAGASGSKRAAAAPRRPLRFEPLEPRLVLSLAPGLVPVGSQPEGTLSGKIVYTSGGHGWEYKSFWTTDRPNLNGMIESFGNQDQLTYYADYLLQAGATVVPMRPVGRQINEVVLDNDSPGVTFSGSWINNTAGPRWYDEDYGAGLDSIKYRFANVNGSSETATATYTPNIPAAGFYPVYTWAAYGGNRTDQLYKINHTGGQTQIHVDHRMVGNGWVYLGTYHFDAGSSATEGSVVISNHSTAGGSVVIADAIRFGNGMGDLPDGPSGLGTGSPSGQPREDEASIFWIWRGFGQGASPSSVVGSSNVSGPSNMAEHMNADTNPFGTSVYIGFHSNAGGGRGAVGLIDADAGDRTPNQSSLALFTGRQINQDMQALNGMFEHNWSTRTTHTFTGQFGEIDLGTNAEMDATIIEVAFHDSVEDAQLLRDPKVRDQLGRSTYEATLEYFVNHHSATNVTLPSPPRNVHAVSAVEGEVTVSWVAGLVGGGVAGVHGNAATGFRIYASTDGYGFDGGTFISGGGTTSATLSGYDPTLPYYFKVAAMNAGGQSKASEVLTVLPSGGVKQVLIVNGFDRHDRFANFQYTSLPPRSSGVSDRVWTRYNNSFDYVIQVHAAISASKPGVHVASTSNEAVISGAVNLNDYQTVIWILGNESTVDDTFNATEQTKVTQFLAAGGNLFLSGAEVGWDLDQQNNGRSFFENTLKGNYVADDAGTYTATAAGGSIFAGLASFAFSQGSSFSSLDSQSYNVSTPDVLAPLGGAISALTYSGGTGGTAAIQYGPGGIGSGSIVMFGFPFESMTNAMRRQQAMGRILDFFRMSAPAPVIGIETRVNGQDADSPPGVTLPVGSTATFTYLVTNAGNVPLSGVVVTDNNGTGSSGDDFTPTFTGGDTNSNNQLDVGETWTYTATRSVTAGQYTNIGTVTATGNAQAVSDTDPANHFGAAPGIDIETLVNGQDADSPPGESLPVGSTATFTYVVTNTGNVTLHNIVVKDNNGSGISIDDFNPTFTGGDTNGNNQLDLGETWTYTATRTVTAGQFTNTATVTAIDSIIQSAMDSDSANHFGVAVENADFNGSGLVDAADYVIWRKFNGATSGATPAQGDANGDGAVDNEDYEIWQQQFGSSPGGGGDAAEESDVAAAASEPLSVMAVEPAPVSEISPAAQDAAIGLLESYTTEKLVSRRPNTALRHRLAERVHGADWSAILAALAERKASREKLLSSSPSDRDGLHTDAPISPGSVVERLLPVGLSSRRALDKLRS